MTALAVFVALVLAGGTATLRAVAGTDGSDNGGDDVGYTGAPSYLDPTIAPYFLPESLETFAVAPIETVTRRSDVPGDVTGGWDPSVSADGRFVVFTSPVAGSPDRTTVLLRDRATNELFEVTPDLPEFANRSSRGGVISADGCVVAVITTTPYDVFRDDDSGERWDVYRQFMPQCSDNPDEGGGEWELVSTAPDGSLEAVNSVDPDTRLAISGAGTVVAYRSLPPARFGEADPVGHVMVTDATITLGEPGRVTVAPGLPEEPAAGQFTVAGQGSPAMSADGRYVAFTDDASADVSPPVWADGPVPGGPATAQVYVWDRRSTTGTAVLVSAGPAGEPLLSGAGEPTVSGDGRAVAFVARAGTINGIIDGDCVGCPANVFVLDRDTDGNGVVDEPEGTSLVPVSAASGVLGDADSAWPVFGQEGRVVAYSTKARNLVPGAIGGAGVLVLTDVKTGTTTVRSTEAATLHPAAVVLGRPAMSDNARSVLFETTQPLVLGAAVGGDGTSQIVAITSTPAVHVDDVDVGTTLVNATTQRSTTVTNAGPGAFVPASIASTSPSFVVSGGTCAVGVPVPAGDTCTVDLTFSATSLGYASSQLIVSEEGVAAVTVAANVSGNGGVPKVSADPDTLSYSDALVTTVGETQSVVIRNVGNGPTIVSSVSISGVHTDDYVIDADQCTGFTVPDLGACVVRITFRPTTAGVRSAVLLVNTIDGAVTRTTLSGRGFYTPSISVTPSAVDGGGKVTVTGQGFPADVDVTVSWEGVRGAIVHTGADGTFTTIVGTTHVSPGDRTIVVADGVPAGATPRFTALRSSPVHINETGQASDANSPVFDGT